MKGYRQKMVPNNISIEWNTIIAECSYQHISASILSTAKQAQAAKAILLAGI